MARIPDYAFLDVRILSPKPEIRITDLSSAMVGMLMRSSKFFLFSHEAHLNSGPGHPYPNISENGDFFSVFKKNPRPQEYDKYLVWRAFSKTSIFVVENAVYVWAGGANGRVDGASGIRLLVELYCVIVIKPVAFFTVCATLTMAVTLTSLLLSFCSSVSGCGCGFRFEQKYLRIDGFGQKKPRICIPLDPLPSTMD